MAIGCGLVGLDTPRRLWEYCGITRRYSLVKQGSIKIMSSLKVSYSELVKQLSALQVVNAALVIRAASNDRLPLQGSYSVKNGVRTMTVSFTCNDPAVVRSKNKSAKQGTQAIFSQARGGQSVTFDDASQKQLHIDYGQSDVRLIGSIGIR